MPLTPIANLIGSVRRHWKRMLVELLIVFVGVYGAFMLNSIREADHARKVQLNYYKSFKEELNYVAQYAKFVKSASDTLHHRYNTAIANGEKPQLQVHPELDFPINMFIVRSTFNQQHFETVDSHFLVNVSKGSNFISLLQKRVDLFQDKSRDLQMLTGPDPNKLYSADGKLLPSYQWYLQDLAYISFVAEQLNIAIEKGAIPDTEKFLQQLSTQ